MGARLNQRSSILQIDGLELPSMYNISSIRVTAAIEITVLMLVRSASLTISHLQCAQISQDQQASDQGDQFSFRFCIRENTQSKEVSLPLIILPDYSHAPKLPFSSSHIRLVIVSSVRVFKGSWECVMRIAARVVMPLGASAVVCYLLSFYLSYNPYTGSEHLQPR